MECAPVVASEVRVVPCPRKRSENSAVERPTKIQRAEWTTTLVESLIEIRYIDIAKQRFNSCKTNKQKASWWAWLTSRLNTRSGVAFTDKQVKNRFAMLKTEYRAMTSAINETGNGCEDLKHPLYWDTLVAYMQDQPGMLAEPIMDSISAPHADSDEDTEAAYSPEPTKKIIDRRQTPKQTLGSSLVEGMGSVATALVEMAKIKKDDSSLAPMLSRIETKFDEQAVINENNSASSAAIA